MDGTGGIFGLLAKRMAWLGQRQSLVARNIANSDTPDFVPKDLSESRFRAMLSQQTPRAQLAATHGAHIIPGALRGQGAKAEEAGDVYEASPSGNAVILEQELIKMNQVQADHSMMVNLYRKNMEFMRLVLQGRR